MEVQCFSFGPFVLIPTRQALLRKGIPVRLGTRALEILTVLVQRPGEVIGKQELMSLVWADTFVDDSNLKVHIAALRRALDEDGSQPSCIATVIGRGYRFVEPVLNCAMRRSTDQADELNSPPNCSERLFGREEIVHRLAMQVEGNRLVTIVGSAGAGKTAVAVAVAETLKRKFEHGTCFVDMNTLKDPSHLPQAVAAALGIEWETNSLSEQLMCRLRSAELLMIMDTCEVAIDSAAALVEFIYSSCPHAHILATSRETLRASGERVFRLPALETPPRGIRMTAAEVQSYPAVQLFLDRATEKPEDRELTDAEAALIAALCGELDGIPLAIELAARRVRALGFDGLPSVFTDHFFSLNYGERTGPPRHQSLGAALDWSLDRLPANERFVLLRLASIEGCFDLDEGILRASGHVWSRAETAACIANLVSKSLVERQGYSRVNFRLLNSVRYYASQKLTACSNRQCDGATEEDSLAEACSWHGRERALQIGDGEPMYARSAKDGSIPVIPREGSHSISAAQS